MAVESATARCEFLDLSMCFWFVSCCGILLVRWLMPIYVMCVEVLLCRIMGTDRKCGFFLWGLRCKQIKVLTAQNFQLLVLRYLAYILVSTCR